MDKKQLLEIIQSLPDDLYVQPLELLECIQEASEWESLGRHTSLGGVYQKDVRNTLVLRIQFKTRYEGEFRRTYENKLGEFRNVRRIG